MCVGGAPRARLGAVLSGTAGGEGSPGHCVACLLTARSLDWRSQNLLD